MAIFLKDPGAVIDYAVDWSAGYLAGQAITASEWSVVPESADGITIAGAVSEAGRTVATLAGGAPGTLYRITNRVTFSDGRSDERLLTLRVEDR